MKERPILFSDAMVRAILSGQKTQTRRVVKPQPPSDKPRSAWFEPGVMGWATTEVPAAEWHRVRCPYGHPGDRLWVREAWRTYASLDHLPPRSIRSGAGIQYEAGGSSIDGEEKLHGMGKYRPPMFMPRWACRVVLEIVSVRVERLNDISETDALEEGITYNDLPNNGLDPMRARTWFRGLWDSINGAGSWGANPWVWVIEFKRETP